jgi:hypothetical protein
MLLFPDLAAAHTALAAGDIACPTDHCDGHLAPWGHAPPRRVRLAIDRVTTIRHRRGRCRTCRHTHVLSDLVTHPHRLDTVEAVGRAMLAACDGLGYRAIAAVVDRPATTVRDWLRRARANAEVVRANATRAFYRFEANPDRLDPAGGPLRDMAFVYGAATAARVRRAGPHPAPWRLAAYLTRAALLAPHPAHLSW